MASYQYLRDIPPEDLMPDQPREYTPAEKRKNWWDYHWKTLVIGGFFVFLGIWMLSDMLRASPAPDLTIAVVAPGSVPQETLDALETALTPLITDRNGDGQVLVEARSYNLHLSETAEDMGYANEPFAGDSVQAYDNMAAATQLSADYQNNESYLFLLYDPLGFQQYTQGLLYLDGTVPEEISTQDTAALEAIDWYNFVYRWTDCPVLAGLELGEYTIPLSGETGSSQQLLSKFYLARRIVISEGSQSAFDGCAAFWDTLTAGAVSSAGPVR